MIKIMKDNLEAEVKKLIEKKMIALEHPEESKVREIIKKVKGEGDKALTEYTKKFDGVELKFSEFKVQPSEFDEAYSQVSEKFLSALKLAVKNITDFHAREKLEEFFETLPEDAVLGLRNVVIDKVGIYVPGGEAAYPSTVLMNAIPAKVAGVAEIIMVTPPAQSGKVNPHILVAAKEVGVKQVYKIGGAQAIAALAFGTETIPKVDKIIGPGNIYVTLAKKLLFGIVGIESLAGPSDILVIADSDANARFIAADLLSQAEHDPRASTVLITTSQKLAEEVKRQIEIQVESLSRKEIIKKSLKENGAVFVVGSLSEAARLANQIAPEHLQLLASPPQELLEKIKHAGAVFLGPYSPEVVGDYIAGPNHVLPTAGTARFSSPLGVYDFVKKQSIVGYTKAALEKMRQEIKALAEAEGLDAHAKAVEIRFED